MRMTRVFVSLLIPVLVGCAPVISRDVLKSVDKDLQFNEVLGNPDKHKGKSVLLGGDIIETNPVQDKTLILVLQRPLGFRDKPSADGGSEGRFIVEAVGFLDPAIYSAKRQVTVVGTVARKEVRPLGKIDYAYPVIASKELYLWPTEESGSQPRFYFGVGVGKTF